MRPCFIFLSLAHNTLIGGGEVISKRILILWYSRTLILSFVALFTALCVFPHYLLPLILLQLAFTAALFLLLYLRYRSLVICVNTSSLIITCGAVIKRTLKINFESIVAVEAFSTPLSERFELANLIIYCEGAKFITFPLENSDIENLRSKLKQTEGD